jgi:hypothetical protein
VAARYQIDLRDQAGALVGVIAEWVSLRYTSRINAVGEFELRLDQSNPNVGAFVLDAQVEVRRQDLAASPAIPQYTDFAGFHRTPAFETDSADDDIFRSIGVSYDDLLARRVIAYPTDSVGAAKAGVGETVMKAYVDENGGVLSILANGRHVAGVFPGLTVPASAGGGGTWEGDRAGRRLIDVLREISDATDVDFQVVNTGPATWEFRAQLAPIGADRSVTGLNPATGLNGAGNAPVIFSLGAANMGAPAFTTSRVNEKTVAIVLGQGIQADRATGIVTAAAATDSPWNAIEAAFNASEEAAAAGLAALGAAKLEELQARESFDFDILQQPGTLYGRDYFLGDLVTARYLTFQRNVKIMGIAVEVIGGVEAITAELTNVT